MLTEKIEKVFIMTDPCGVPAVRFMRGSWIPGNQPRPARCYEYLKVFIVTSGSGVWKIGDKRCEIAKNDIVILNNVESRTILEVTGGVPLVMDYAAFLPTAAYPNMNCTRIFYRRARDFSHVLGRENRYYPPLRERMLRLYDDAEAASGTPYANEKMFCMLTEILLLASLAYDPCPEEGPDRAGCTPAYYRLVTDALKYISENPAADLSVGALGRRYHISPQYFSQVFKTLNGVSPARFVRNCRVQSAAALVQNRDMPLIEAAFASGFNSVSGFYKAVKELTGMTPAEFVRKT